MNYYETSQESTFINTNQPVYQNQPYYRESNQTYYQDAVQPVYDMSYGGQISNEPPPADEAAVPETVESKLFVPGFLQTQLGKLMRIEFLVGNTVQDRVGILRQVGASYIIIQPVGESSMTMCDLFSIRFATIINRPINGEEIIVT